jgi:hypothetical protein
MDDAEDGYANDSPMETLNRFPQGFGNLAKDARFPHSHSQDHPCGVERREEPNIRGQRLDQQLTVSVAPPVVAGFEVSIDGRFSGVHRGRDAVMALETLLQDQRIGPWVHTPSYSAILTELANER